MRRLVAISAGAGVGLFAMVLTSVPPVYHDFGTATWGLPLWWHATVMVGGSYLFGVYVGAMNLSNLIIDLVFWEIVGMLGVNLPLYLVLYRRLEPVEKRY